MLESVFGLDVFLRGAGDSDAVVRHACARMFMRGRTAHLALSAMCLGRKTTCARFPCRLDTHSVWGRQSARGLPGRDSVPVYLVTHQA